jgi:YgiT-type zinc finger domain-containing protein
MRDVLLSIVRGGESCSFHLTYKIDAFKLKIYFTNKRVRMMKTYDDCSLCGGEVIEKRVQKVCWWGDRLVAVIEDVPAGVCQQCGERY